jgi:hypothetical protein
LNAAQITNKEITLGAFISCRNKATSRLDSPLEFFICKQFLREMTTEDFIAKYASLN